VVTAASDRRMRRRGGRRKQADSTPAVVGTALREAREASGVSLVEIQDRTGVPESQLEALEAGNLSLFPDLQSALTAVRRYSDLVKLDVDGFARVVEESWGTSQAGFEGAAATGKGATKDGTQGAHLTGAVPAGHLSRYPGDGTHLRAFTQTDEVPGVRRAVAPAGNGHDAHAPWSVTGSFPAVPGGYKLVRQAPWILRAAVWFVASLLVVALLGLAVQHYQPQFLADIHLVHHTTTTPATTPASPGTKAHPGAPAHASAVTLTGSGTGSATVSVRASNYSVVVAAWAPCWTVVHSPQSFSPVFAATLQGGQVKQFNSANGQLTLSMSASLVTVQVRIGGKTVPGFLFKPTSVPFTLNFDSTS
jgi:Helix-turn-helix domain